MQLFCFTVAGGTATFFNQLEELCVPELGLVKLEYPGHGLRRKEKLCETFQELSLDLYEQIRKKYSGQEYAMMGYSMGSIALLETLWRVLEKNELPEPKHIFLAAHEPEIVINMRENSSEKSDEYVKNRTIHFGGVPDRLVDNKTFWRMYLPLYRADYQMISKYDFDSLKYVSGIPVTIFFSEQDTPRIKIEG